MSRTASTLSIGFAFLVIAACSRLPAPDEVAAPNEEVVALVRLHEDSISRDGIAPHRIELKVTMSEVGRRYGKNSSAVVQAHSEAAVMVYQAATAADAIEFFREWLRVSEAIYGHDHRETAFALSDFGRIQILAADDGRAPRAVRWLREALEVRRRVLGPDHLETAASEGFVAEQLLAICEGSASCPPGDSRLVAAAELAAHAHGVYLRKHPAGHSETRDMHRLLGRVRGRNRELADKPDSAYSREGAETPTR